MTIVRLWETPTGGMPEKGTSMSKQNTLQSDLAEAAQSLPPIVSLREAATFMRLSTRTLRRLISAGRLQTTKADPSSHGKVLVLSASIFRVLSGEA